MALDMFKIPSQYLTKNQITVTVLDVINPAHFVIKETPDVNASSEAKNFLEAEESMQKYYGTFDQGFFQLPLKDAIIVVLHEKKFYRAKVIKILNLSAGHLFKVYLVDYGVECSVTRDRIYKIEKDFLSHPFQAVNMKLLGIEPVSLVMNSVDLSMSYGPVTYWDPSAVIYINDMQRTLCNAYVEIKAVDEQCVYGSIFICFEDNSVKCINEELISNKYASFDENCWNKVHKIEDVLENNISKCSEKKSTPEPKKPDPSSTSDFSPPENSGDFIELRSSFISPSDGKIIATSSISMKTTEPSLSNPEDFEDKVQEKFQAVTPDVPVENSPDSKASALSRFQKLQILNQKRHSSQSNVATSNLPSADVEKSVAQKNLLSDVSSDKAESSDHIDAVQEMMSCGTVPSSANPSHNLDDHDSQSDTHKFPSSNVNIIETKEGNDALSRSDTSNRLKKLQELRRKQQNSPISNDISTNASTVHGLSSAPCEKSVNSSGYSNLNIVEGSNEVKQLSSVSLTSPKQECASKVDTHVLKLKKLQELQRKRLNNSASSTDSTENSMKNLNLCDNTFEKDISEVPGAHIDSLMETNNNKTNEQRKLSHSENSKSPPVQQAVSKDMSSIPKSVATNRLSKLQELHRKSQSNSVSSGNQPIDARVSCDLKHNLNVPHDKKVDNDSENLKLSPVQPSISKDMCYSPASATPSKLSKLREIHKKHQSNIVSSGDTDTKVSSDVGNNLRVPINNKEDSSAAKVECCDSENSKPSVQPSTSFDSATELATTSKLSKLQELHKKRRSNIVFSRDQPTDTTVSSDFENDPKNVPKIKKDENLNVIDGDHFSDCNTDNVSNVSCDSISFKASRDSPFVSEVACNASSPSSLENSPRQDGSQKAQTYASKRFQKLQELNKKRQSSAKSNVHPVNNADECNMEDSATSDKDAIQSPDSSLNRFDECMSNANLPTALSDIGSESHICNDATDVSANSIFRDNTVPEVESKANESIHLNLVTPSNSKAIHHAAASEKSSKQESILETKISANSKFQKLQLLKNRKSSSISQNLCQGADDNLSTSSEKKENVSELMSTVDSAPDDLNARESEETKESSTVKDKLSESDDINSNYQVLDVEKPSLKEMGNATAGISPRQENKQMILSERARTLQRLQQNLRKKNMELQPNPSLETLADHQNQNSQSSVQNSEEIPISITSDLSKQSLDQEYSSLSESEGKVCEMKDSLNRKSQEIPQTSNIIHESNQPSAGASPVSNASSGSSVAQNSQASSSKKNTRVKMQKSPSNSSRSNLDSEDSSPMRPQQSQILQQMLDATDSDDVLYCVPEKKRESTCDIDVEGNYIELSTQLKHSDPKTLEFNELSLWQKQKVPALQIGIGLINPILNVDEANFSNHVKQMLKEIKFYGPSCIQSVIWPSIEKNRCMVAVAPPHSGKTVSYVLPLVSSFTEGRKGPKSHNNGPSAIILCSSWLKAQAVYDLFYFFLGDKKMSIITLCTDGGHYRNKVISLINSCDVLIATPYCLLQFLMNNSIKFTQLDNLILDDSTALMNKHKKELKDILLNYMHAIKREGVASQLLLFAERWDKNFELILNKMMSNPLILFTSFLESAVYAKISIIAHVCQSEEKKSALIDVVAKEVGKVVICTTNILDAVDIHRFLSCEDVRSFLVNEEMEHYIVDEVIRDWKSIKCIANPHCLVITDQVLIKRLSISDADCLIHYDIPQESRLQFGNRFSCIAEHFKATDHPHCVSHILVAESDYSYATQIKEIIKNSGGKPSEALVELGLKQEQVEASSDSLCPYLKAFGLCTERLCKNRHTIDSEKDKPQIKPFEGDIQGFVTHIVDASHYYVRLLKYLDPVSNTTVSLVSAYAELGFSLRDFYCSAPDEMKVDKPVVGESYVLSEEYNLFYRVKVLKKVTKETSTSWKLLFLDEGWIKYYEKPVLYELTDQIDLPEPQAIEVYVCNIITPDSCLEWNPQTSQLVSDLIKGKEIHGRIALCLGRTLWLEPIALVLPLPNLNEFVNLFKLNQKLLDCGHARPNKNHLVTLRKACTGKIPHPHVVKQRIKKEEKTALPIPTISHAFLECNTWEDVYVSGVKSPHQFYVQRAKFVECLDNLLDKMNDQIENRMLKRAFTLYKGMHCIAPFYEDNRYYRAMITDVFDSEIQLFYVDFGDKGKAPKSNIYSIPAEFLLLPFQAIECELAGIAPAHGGWTDSSVDALTTLTRDENGDMKILQSKAYSKTSCYEGGNHYVIDLWFNDKNLSEQLLQAGLGIPAEIPETTKAEPPVKAPQVSSPECSSDEEFNLNENKLSSDSEDPEDRDTTALFYGYVAEMVMQAANLVPKPGVEITEVSSDDDLRVSNANDNEELKAQNAYKDLVKLLPNMNLGNRSGSSLEQSSSCLRPLITWWDTPEQLNILINLKDIKMYQLVVADTGFNFNTIIAGTQYSADEKFYDDIQSSDVRKYQTAQGINIIAKKLTPFKWPRFTKEKKKFLHIKYDLVHIDDSDSDNETSSAKKQNLRQDYVDESSSSSTDEEEKYVETWKDFAQQKNPFSVLE